MTPKRHEQIEKLFHAVLEIEADRRSAFLDEACGGDSALREELDSLLTSHDDAGEFISVPALEVAARTLGEAAPALVPEGRIDQYEILSLLGSGGMGDVYLAQDTQLERKVAIKFLQPQMIADPQARERLLREARAAAKLDHPNICAIYQVVADEHRSFIVMQYVEGETLAAHIARGPLATERALDIAGQAASALAEAHNKGIVHRDIKPQNIMITPAGRVQVLDFGLARTIANTTMSPAELTTRNSLTEDGLVMGTVAYMSPEQLRGETVDARTDIFSVGIVIYEMLTGRQPFICDSQAETIAGILKVEPPSPRQFAPRVPAYLVTIIAKALKKEKAERYASGTELMKDLQARTPRSLVWPKPLKYGMAAALLVLAVGLAVWRLAPLSGVDSGIRSIAVLPLQNLSGDSSQDYFSAGITESLISTLAQIRSLKVISRTSVMRYKATDKPLPEIGRELGVDAILTGSVQQAGGRVRINAQLIQATTDSHLWAQEYERDVADLLQLEGEVAQSIASRIRMQLTADETRRLTGRKINPEAQQAYLRGRYYSYNMNDHDQSESIRNFEEAIRLQPDFGAAYAGIAFGWISRFDLGFVPFQEAEPQVREAATKAIQLAPELPDGHVTLADLSVFNWDWKAGEQGYRRALELDPNSLDGRNDYSYFLITQGRLPEAIAQIERAAALDPLSPMIHVTFGLALTRARRYPEAKQHFQRVLELEPMNPIALRNLTNVAEQMGDLKKALSLIERQLPASGGDIMQVSQAGRIYAKLGRRADALRVLDNVTKPGARAAAMQVASLYFALGDKDHGFEWLTKAFDRHEVVNLLKTDPLFDSVHSDPRFQALLRRLGLPD